MDKDAISCKHHILIVTSKSIKMLKSVMRIFDGMTRIRFRKSLHTIGNSGNRWTLPCKSLWDIHWVTLDDPDHQSRRAGLHSRTVEQLTLDLNSSTLIYPTRNPLHSTLCLPFTSPFPFSFFAKPSHCTKNISQIPALRSIFPLKLKLLTLAQLST